MFVYSLSDILGIIVLIICVIPLVIVLLLKLTVTICDKLGRRLHKRYKDGDPDGE